VMPGMSGIELGQEIRRRYAHLPVVPTSGDSHVLAQNGTHGSAWSGLFRGRERSFFLSDNISSGFSISDPR